MKTVNVALALALGLVVLAACSEDFLDKKPLVNQTADTFFQTADHAVQATNATYSLLRDWQVHVFSYIGMTDIVSDDADKGSTVDDATFLRELDEFTFDASNIGPATVWQGYYRAIYRANLAIEEIPAIEMDAELKDRLVAENQFLRAYFYFNLVRWFGGVPLITSPLSPDEYEQPRASVEEVYAQILADFSRAAEVLPEKSEYTAADLGRATKGAANAYLAKVYLTLENWQAEGLNTMKYKGYEELQIWDGVLIGQVTIWWLRGLRMIHVEKQRFLLLAKCVPTGRPLLLAIRG